MSEINQPTDGNATAEDLLPADITPSKTLNYGVRTIGGLPVPDAFRYDPEFLGLDENVQVVILRQIASNRLQVRLAPVSEKTERHSVGLSEGQWLKLGDLAKHCKPYTADRRRSLNESSLLREFLAVGLALLVPHLDLTDVSTEQALRSAMLLAFEKAAAQSMRTI